MTARRDFSVLPSALKDLREKSRNAAISVAMTASPTAA
jgi:hypothetical protein